MRTLPKRACPYLAWAPLQDFLSLKLPLPCRRVQPVLPQHVCERQGAQEGAAQGCHRVCQPGKLQPDLR